MFLRHFGISLANLTLETANRSSSFTLFPCTLGPLQPDTLTIMAGTWSGLVPHILKPRGGNKWTIPGELIWVVVAYCDDGNSSPVEVMGAVIGPFMSALLWNEKLMVTSRPWNVKRPIRVARNSMDDYCDRPGNTALRLDASGEYLRELSL